MSRSITTNGKETVMNLYHAASVFSFAFLMVTTAFADEPGPGFGGRGHGGRHGGGPPAEVVQAMEACATANGIVFTPGTRPQLTDAQRASLDQCLAAKGFQPPPRGSHRGEPPADESAPAASQ